MNIENLPPTGPVVPPGSSDQDQAGFFAEGEEIKIRLLKGPARAWLSLSGTILTYRGHSWGLKECVDIPLELLVTSKRKRFVGTRLILALLSLLVGPALGGAVIGIYSLSHAKVPGSLVSISMAIGGLTGVVLFLIMLVMFCIRESTITLNIAGGKMALEFWAGSQKKHTALNCLLREIENRAATIEETIPFPMRTAAGEIIHQPWKRTVLLTCLCAIPGLMIENAWLLLICLVPPAWHLCSALKFRRMPTAFRQAVKCSLKQEWGDAQRYVDSLIEEHPDFLPAHLMRINLLCREGRFNDSEMALSRVEKELDLETVHGIQEELILRRRIWGRKFATITNGDRLIA
jgi:hypothetical protein